MTQGFIKDLYRYYTNLLYYYVQHYYILIYYITDTYPPSAIKAAQYGSTITVYWTPPTVGATPTGYMIYYQASGEEVKSVTVNGGSLTQHDVVGVQENKVYTITMLTLSHMLPSRDTQSPPIGIGKLLLLVCYYLQYSPSRNTSVMYSFVYSLL